MKYSKSVFLFATIPVVFVCIVIYFLRDKNIEKYTNNTINFMTHNDTEIFLKNDRDNYVKNMTDIDLYARKVKSYKEYLDNIASISISYTDVEKSKIERCVHHADDFFKKIDFGKIGKYKKLNNNDILKIQWVFALTYKKGNIEYEEGLPHTRDNVIFLSKYVLNYTDIDLTNTLIHEKIHIYQRYNPSLFSKIIYDMNYYILPQDAIKNKRFIRSNPDIDKNVYFDKTTNKENTCLYRTDKPSGINDIIITNFSIEHPYERIAYDIASLYYKKNADMYKDI